MYLEFQWVQALQNLTTQNIIAWALLVASRHASVMFQNEYNFTADSLLDSIQKIRDYNNSEATKGNNACYINKIILGNRPCIKDVMTAAGLATTTQVVYDRHLEKNNKGGNKGMASDADATMAQRVDSQNQVSVVISMANYRDPKTMANSIQAMMNIYLNQAHIMQAIFGTHRPPQVEVQVQPTGKWTSHVLTASHTEVAKHLCSISSMDVRVGDTGSMAQISFSSQHHQLLASDYKHRFQTLAILDVSRQHGVYMASAAAAAPAAQAPLQPPFGQASSAAVQAPSSAAAAAAPANQALWQPFFGQAASSAVQAPSSAAAAEAPAHQYHVQAQSYQNWQGQYGQNWQDQQHNTESYDHWKAYPAAPIGGLRQNQSNPGNQPQQLHRPQKPQQHNASPQGGLGLFELDI